MKKKELKRELIEARAEIDMLKAQLAAEKLNSAWGKSSVDILREELTEARSDHKMATGQLRAHDRIYQSKITSLKSEIDDIKRELAQKTIQLEWFYEKGSGELWSINDFLNTMAENLEKIANKRNLEGNSIKIDIIPIPLKDGLIRGYTSIVMPQEY